jgi:hypothetical protein
MPDAPRCRTFIQPSSDARFVSVFLIVDHEKNFEKTLFLFDLSRDVAKLL